MFRATEANRAEIEAFLLPHAEYAMFTLSNIAHFGMDGEAPYSVKIWVARAGDMITDVLALTNNGMAMPYLPSGNYSAAAQILSGVPLAGIVGPKPDARGLSNVLNLKAAKTTRDSDEPHFRLDLDRLNIPDGPGQIVPLSEAPFGVLLDWMIDYNKSILGADSNAAQKRAEESLARNSKDGTRVVLMDGAKPLATTAFNATLSNIVQIGGVYTPPDLRGRGFARRAVALHLRSVRARGVSQATLFAASDQAARAYKAIGFEKIGEWALVLFQGEVVSDA